MERVRVSTLLGIERSDYLLVSRIIFKGVVFVCKGVV
jgi:hypothetical protein